MSIIGIGTDIVQVSRIARMVDKNKLGLAQRILHKNELELFNQKPSPIAYLAKRFAAKEAVAKALGIGIAKGISFNEIEISNNSNGKPEVTLHGQALEFANQLGVEQCFLSLSDEKKYALAYVVLEGSPSI